MPFTRQKLFDGLLALAICATTAWVVHEAAMLISADWTSSIARHDLVKWASGEAKYTDEDWNRVHGDLSRALALTPDDATLHDALAQLYSVKGRNLWTTGASGSPELAAYQQARLHQEASIKLRPTNAMAWANLALQHYAVNSTANAMDDACREAIRLGPKEIDVENTLILLVAGTWSQAPSDIREWAESRRPGLTAKLNQTAQASPQPASSGKK